MNKLNFFKEIESLKFLAKKEVGQNFLIDQDAAEKIVKSLDINDGEKVLEIGCGAGSISFFLAQYKNPIDLIDIDEALLTKVKEDFKECKNMNICWGNAMDFDYSSYDKIIGNLPYYITSGIIEKMLLSSSKVSKAIFMVQKEAANRLLIKQGEDITPLTLYLNYIADVKRLFNVGRNSFTPIPHVDSSVIELEFRKDKHNEEAAKTFKFIKSMFLNKRKTITNNLKNYLKSSEKVELILKKVKIASAARPEQISFEQFIDLYNEVKTN